MELYGMWTKWFNITGSRNCLKKFEVFTTDPQKNDSLSSMYFAKDGLNIFRLPVQTRRDIYIYICNTHKYNLILQHNREKQLWETGYVATECEAEGQGTQGRLSDHLSGAWTETYNR